MRGDSFRIACCCWAAAMLTVTEAARAEWTSFQLQPFVPQVRAALGGAVSVYQPSALPSTGQPASAFLWAGAPFASGSARESGLVHAWQFLVVPGESWSYAWQFGSVAPQSGAAFGAAIASGPSFVVVGSPLRRMTGTQNLPAGQAAGFAELRSLPSPWTSPVEGTSLELPHPTLSGGDMYGSAVDVMLVGQTWHALASAPRDDMGSATDAGSVQAFRRDAATAWVHAGEASLPDAGADERLGESLASMAGRFFASVRRRAGAVAVFTFVDGAPMFESLIPAPDALTHGFGRAIACDGTLLAVGAPGAIADAPGEGLVYLFDAEPPHALRSTIPSPFPEECAGFGSSISFRRGTLVVGTEQGSTSIASGKVVVYDVDASSGIVELAFVEGDGAETGFGCAVATGGAHVAIGLPGAGNGVQGSIRVRSLRPALRTPDLNGDGIVSGADLGILLGRFGELFGEAADLNYDNRVDGADLGILLGAWGTAG